MERLPLTNEAPQDGGGGRLRPLAQLWLAAPWLAAVSGCATPSQPRVVPAEATASQVTASVTASPVSTAKAPLVYKGNPFLIDSDWGDCAYRHRSTLEWIGADDWAVAQWGLSQPVILVTRVEGFSRVWPRNAKTVYYDPGLNLTWLQGGSTLEVIDLREPDATCVCDGAGVVCPNATLIAEGLDPGLPPITIRRTIEGEITEVPATTRCNAARDFVLEWDTEPRLTIRGVALSGARLVGNSWLSKYRSRVSFPSVPTRTFETGIVLRGVRSPSCRSPLCGKAIPFEPGVLLVMMSDDAGCPRKACRLYDRTTGKFASTEPSESRRWGDVGEIPLGPCGVFQFDRWKKNVPHWQQSLQRRRHLPHGKCKVSWLGEWKCERRDFLRRIGAKKMAPRLPEMPVCKPGKSAVETCCSKLEQLPDFENAPWSREDPRKGVCDLGQGGYYWPIWGKLPLKTCDEGWVIQHIRMTMNVVLQDGTKMTKIRVQDQILDLPSDISFWEAWRFGAYSQTSERYGVMSDDTYKWSSCPGSTGNIIIMGYAKFVPGPLPSHFKGTGEEGSVPYAGWLAHSTYRKPNGWNDRSCVEHFLTCDWDKYTSKVIGRFGSTTLVGQQVPNPPNPH